MARSLMQMAMFDHFQTCVADASGKVRKKGPIAEAVRNSDANACIQTPVRPDEDVLQLLAVWGDI